MLPAGCLDFDQFLEDGGVATDAGWPRDVGATDVGEARSDGGGTDVASPPDAADASQDSGAADAADTGADAAPDASFDGASDSSYPSDASDAGEDAGTDGGEDAGTDSGTDAGEEYVIQQMSVYEAAAGACGNDEFDLRSTSGWGARSEMENDEFVSRGKVLFF